MGAVAIFLSIGLPSLLRAAPGAPSWASPPATPGNSEVALDWNDASGSFTSYRVRHRTSDSSESFTTITGLPTTPTSHTVIGLSNFTSYEFQVGATDSSGVTTWGTVWHVRPRPSLHSSGLPAGGQVNAIVHAAPGYMVAGGDVSGFHRSTDGGVTWRSSTQGVFIGTGTHGVAALAYDSGSGTVYGLTAGGGTGHFWTSANNGSSWTHKSSGSNLYVVKTGGDYPRDVGRLIAVTPSNPNVIYVGTNNNGVQKSTNGGSSWSTLVLGGKQVNGLALDGGFVYAAVANVGVYRFTPSGGLLTLFNGSGAPGNPEELFILDNKLYAAAHTAGIRRLDNASTAGGGATWKNLSVGTTAAWCAIDGYIDGNNHVIVVGNSDAPERGSTGRYITVKKCTNAQASSGFNWVDISSAAGVTVQRGMPGRNGETYWRVDPAKGENYPSPTWGDDKKVDGGSFNIDQIVLDPNNPDKIHVAGQMGIWRTLDGGTTWQPPVSGLATAVLNSVAIDPNNPGRVYVGDQDHCLWISDDYGDSISYVTRPASPGGKPKTFTVAVDKDGLVYVGFEATAGSVWSHNRSNHVWTEIAGANGDTLRTIANTSGKTVHAVAVQHIAGSRVILAAMRDSGIWRLADGGNWTKVQSTVMSGLGTALKEMSFVWPSEDKQLVFFYDQPTGVWRSTNAGQNWTKIWNQGYSSQNTGGMAMRTDTSQLFVATDSGLYRLNNADTASNPSATNLNITNSGKLAAWGDTLWVAARGDGNGTDDVALYRSTDGTNFTQFTNGYYKGAAGRVFDIAADATRQYVTAGVQGIAVSDNSPGGGGGGNPPGQATSPSPANGATGVSTTANSSWTAGSGATSHDVYFGTDSTPDSTEFQGNQAGTTFDPGTLTASTTYYWRIDEVNASGTTTGTVWSFTTASGGGGTTTDTFESIAADDGWVLEDWMGFWAGDSASAGDRPILEVEYQ